MADLEQSHAGEDSIAASEAAVYERDGLFEHLLLQAEQNLKQKQPEQSQKK
jgi:hypothetical protein